MFSLLLLLFVGFVFLLFCFVFCGGWWIYFFFLCVGFLFGQFIGFFRFFYPGKDASV